MRLLVTRPLEDAQELAGVLQAAGHDVLVDPVLEIVPTTEEPPKLDGVQALLATSANGVRAFAKLTPRRDLELFAVGSATAEVARLLGFTKIARAEGHVAGLARLTAARLEPEKGPLMHIAGRHTAGDLKSLLEAHGFKVERQVLYTARAAQALCKETQQRLASQTLDGVLFFSPRSARIFVSLADTAALTQSLERLVAFCLSPPIAEAAEDARWAAIRIAARPDQEALLANIEQASAEARLRLEPRPDGS